MANWITHLIIVDRLCAMGISLDERGFAVGNIAPDCNVENEDWTRFTPPREVTHWMSGKSKLTADYEGFFEKYIRAKVFASREHEAFLWGYYSHLITDVEFQKYIRNENRVRNIFTRVKQNKETRGQIKGWPEDYDTLKSVFGRKRLALDIAAQEINYLKQNPNTRYFTVIKKIDRFPDYLDYLPAGAVARKIGVMAKEDMTLQHPGKYTFFTQDEFNKFTETTSALIFEKIVR